MVVVFDLETTGFSTLNDDIVEFSYISFEDDGTFLRSERMYMYHLGMVMPESAYNVHHISLDFLKQFEDQFTQNIVKMYSILNGNTVCGFNSDKFDCPFASNWLMRMGVSELQFERTIDIMKVYRPVTHQAQIKLTKLSDKMDVTPDVINFFMNIWFPDQGASHAHEASYDTVATAILFQKALKSGLIQLGPQAEKVNPATVDSTSALESTEVILAENAYSVTVVDPDDIEHVILFEPTGKRYDPKTHYCPPENVIRVKLKASVPGVYEYYKGSARFRLYVQEDGDVTGDYDLNFDSGVNMSIPMGTFDFSKFANEVLS